MLRYAFIALAALAVCRADIARSSFPSTGPVHVTGQFRGQPDTNLRRFQVYDARNRPPGNGPGGVYEFDPEKYYEWRAIQTPGHAKLPEEFRWDIEPASLHAPLAVYPHDKLLAGEEGWAAVQFVISKTGDVAEAEIISATAPEFGHAILAMLAEWKFRPARRDGQPCLAGIQAVFDFKRKPIPGTAPISKEAAGVLRRLKKNQKPFTDPDASVALQPRDQNPPVYPPSLKSAGTTGSAEIEFLIDPRGRAILPRIVNTTDAAFGYAAAQAVSAWTFDPVKINGKPTTVRLRAPFTFRPLASR